MKRTTFTLREVLRVLSVVRMMEKGAHISDADRAFKRGWRFACRTAAAEFKGALRP